MKERRPPPYWTVDASPCLWEDGKLPLVLSAEGTTWERRYDLEYLRANARPVSAARFRAMVQRAATAGARAATPKSAVRRPSRTKPRKPTKPAGRPAKKTNRPTRKSPRR